jgi:parallel beta-helix repeat protein
LGLIGGGVAIQLGATAAEAETVECGQTITTNTTLTSDVTGCTGDGIEIGADGITLDLNGHRVTAAPGQNGIGINVLGHSNVQVFTGKVDGFFYGVNIDGNQDQITGVRSTGSVFGFVIDGNGAGGNNNTLLDDIATGTSSSVGIFEQAGDGNVVSGSTAEGASQTGIYFTDGTNNTITGSKAVNNRGNGIEINSERGDKVLKNTVTGNDSAGGGAITLFFTKATKVRNNQVSGNTGGAFYLAGATNSAITGNNARRNGQGGLFAASSSTNTLSGNTFVLNGGPGIQIDSLSTGQVLTGNTSNSNTGDGINDSGASLLTSNTADFNTGHGIVTNGTDGGGNEAHGNKTPPQCIGVIC